MGLFYDRWELFRSGIVKAGTSEEIQRFYRENPTKEMIFWLDRWYEKKQYFMLAGLLLYLVLGILIGWLFTVSPHGIYP